MKKNRFVSAFSEQIESYLHFKCSIGYTEKSYLHRMRQFDAFCAENFPDSKIVTEEILEKWSCLRNGESENNRLQRLIALKGLLNYLKATGMQTYTMPQGLIRKQQSFRPYLYSEEELRMFFRGADTLPAHPSSKYRHLLVPVMFRMHFCCGLRPQETLHLRCCDVNLREGILYIAESKGHKDRRIAMSEDLRNFCGEYERVISRILPDRMYFFQRSQENIPLSADTQGDWFWACLKNSGCTFSGRKRPRVYDFRHNFATYVIKQWRREGKNVSDMLPYLREYMGHSSLEATAYYIHLMPEHFTEDGVTEWEGIPEVPDYED